MTTYQLGPVIGRMGGPGEAFYSGPRPLLEGWTTIAVMTVREPSRALIHIQVDGQRNWGTPFPAVRLRHPATGDTHEYTFAKTTTERTLVADIGPGEWAAEFTGSRDGREHFEATILAAHTPLT